MKALVTGGGGFLGSRICELLRRRGDDVFALGRRSYPHLDSIGVQTIQADIRDIGVVGQACKGMDAVFHTAALATLWGPRQTFWEINVDGTCNVIGACIRHHVSKLIFTSTPSVVFGREPLCGVDESQPYPAHYAAYYPESKAKAEQMVLDANGPDLCTVALRPHLIFGPQDPHLIPRVIARARAGKLRQVGDGANLVDVTYVDNAAQAHLLACDALRPGASCAGKAYFISQGEPVALWPWLNHLLSRLGIPAIRRSVSFQTAYRMGAIMELIHASLRLKSEPKMTRFLALQLAHSHYFNLSAAQRDLGYHPLVSTEEAVERTVAYFQNHPQ